MTVKELAYVALKVTGVYCVVQGLLLLGGVITTALRLPKGELFDFMFFLGFLIPFVLMMLLGFFLLNSTKRIGRMMGLQDLGDSSEIVRVEEFQTVAFSIVGVILVATAIPKFLSIIIRAIYESYLHVTLAGKPARGLEIWTVDNIGLMTELLILVAFGSYLFFRADGIARLWQQFQEKRKLIDCK